MQQLFHATTGTLALLSGTAALAQSRPAADCASCPRIADNWLVVVQGDPTPFLVASLIIALVAFAVGYVVARSKDRNATR